MRRACRTAPIRKPRRASSGGPTSRPCGWACSQIVSSLSEAGVEAPHRRRAPRHPSPAPKTWPLRADLDAKDMARARRRRCPGAPVGPSPPAGVGRDGRAERGRAPALLKGVPIHEAPLQLTPAPEGEEIVGDYASLNLTLRRHPLALLRSRMARLRLLSAQELGDVPQRPPVRACGIVTMRQRPQHGQGHDLRRRWRTRPASST